MRRHHILLLTLSFLILSTPPPAFAGTAAVVDGRTITEQQVDDAVAARLLPAEQRQLYAVRRSALDTLIVRALLEEEAKRRNVSVETLRRQFTEGAVTVDPAEVERQYTENAMAFGAASPDETRERIRLDIETQARMRRYRERIAALKERAAIDVRLREPAVPAVAKGSSDAPVTIVEFSDFECPYCRIAAGSVSRLLRENPKDVRVVYKHLPSPGHPNAFQAARAAFCAGEQNRFWNYHTALFSSNDLSTARLNEAAAEVGLDPAAFTACVSADRSKFAVLSDVEEAKRLGIDSTPTFVINGAMVRGAVPFEQLREIVSRELKNGRSASARIPAGSEEER